MCGPAEPHATSPTVISHSTAARALAEVLHVVLPSCMLHNLSSFHTALLRVHLPAALEGSTSAVHAQRKQVSCIYDTACASSTETKPRRVSFNNKMTQLQQTHSTASVLWHGASHFNLGRRLQRTSPTVMNNTGDNFLHQVSQQVTQLQSPAERTQVAALQIAPLVLVLTAQETYASAAAAAA